MTYIMELCCLGCGVGINIVEPFRTAARGDAIICKRCGKSHTLEVEEGTEGPEFYLIERSAP